MAAAFRNLQRKPERIGNVISRLGLQVHQCEKINESQRIECLVTQQSLHAVFEYLVQGFLATRNVGTVCLHSEIQCRSLINSVICTKEDVAVELILDLNRN